VDFVGPNRCESRGIVDLLAVRKNHAVQSDVLKRGDILDIVLIQVKGGNARFPTQEDVERLKKVARYHKAKAVVLSEWKRGKCPHGSQLFHFLDAHVLGSVYRRHDDALHVLYRFRVPLDTLHASLRGDLACFCTH